MSTRKPQSKPKAAKKPPVKSAQAGAKSSPPTAKSAAGTARPKLAAVPPRQATVPREAMPEREVAPARDVAPAAQAELGRDGTPPRRSPSRSNAFSAKDLKRFEQLLLAERQRLVRELGHLENHVLKRSLRETSGELSGYSFHMADVGTDAMEREKAFHFASAEGRALLDVDAALRRLYGGVYGECESCGSTVGKERLEVVPHARLCVSCKQKEERAQAGRSR